RRCITSSGLGCRLPSSKRTQCPSRRRSQCSGESRTSCGCPWSRCTRNTALSYAMHSSRPENVQMDDPALRELAGGIESLSSTPSGEPLPQGVEATIGKLLDALERGEIRAAERNGDRWEAVPWVKRGILVAFRAGHLTDFSPSAAPGNLRPLSFVD